ncbi:hypothetical protein CLNEO_10830 [Anaerotignum neopropionicum]|uniref:Uncharacterized protein n=1 Tax=Anaerotignum neopropionicum TaxID=36847 RepID=A0A136WHA2_9FIRM|nr:DUF6103 family protein [Anaerotignum neopropionicum]KXL53857.1 hypothetical protein CLNEO_10830 [Anaerotignum neopropionicum]
MKKATLTITFEKEKLDALTYYMEKKDVKLQAELSDTIQKLYEKYVPQPTREYIEDKLKCENMQSKPKKMETAKVNVSQTVNGNS